MKQVSSVKSNPKNAGTVQPKLTVSSPGDPYELEADTMAERILRRPAHENGNTLLPNGIGASGPGKGGAGEPSDKQTKPRLLMRKAQGSGGFAAPSGLVSQLGRGGGSPLPGSTRNFMEGAFSADFSRVRVHTDGSATQMNQQIQAKAFTHGQDIYFNQGQYAPESREGKRLLAHELTHVLQQTVAGRPPVLAPSTENSVEPFPVRQVPAGVIQRDEEDPVEEDLGNGLYLQQWPMQGQALLWYRNQRWCFFQWTGGLSSRMLTFSFQTDAERQLLTVNASASFRVQAHINHRAEQLMSDFNGLPVRVRYNLQFPGAVRIHTQAAESTTAAEPLADQPTPTLLTSDLQPRSRTYVDAEGRQVVDTTGVPGLERAGEAELPTNFTHSRQAPVRSVSRVWSFNSQADFNRFATNHPDTNWACIVMPDGQFVAYALTSEALHRLAANIRRGTYRGDFLSEFNGQVSTVFLNGHPLSTVEDLSNLYFASEEEAWLGSGASRGMAGTETLFEGVIFRMPGDMYGRRAMPHAEALNFWARISDMPEDEVFAIEQEPGTAFYELVVKGQRGYHTIDQAYFQARESFRQNTQRRAADPSLNSVLTSEFRGYMLIEADRPTTHLNTSFAQAIGQDNTAAFLLQTELFDRVAQDAQSYATNSVRSAYEGVQRLATSREAMANFVLNFHALDEPHQTEALAYIGLSRLPASTLPFMVTEYRNREYDQIRSWLNDPVAARQIALGIHDLQTVESLQAYAANSASGLQRALNQFQQGTIRAIDLEGEVGDAARASAYQTGGFTRLRPDDYPHRSDVSDYLPQPMAGETRLYGSIGEQLFANYVARRSQTEQLVQIATFVGLAALTVSLALISGGIGAGVAGMFLTEGSAAFIGTEIVVGGLAFTALNEGVGQLRGQGDFSMDDLGGSAQRLGWQALKNILTFGLFRGATSLFGALGTRLAGGAAAVSGSTGRAALAGGIRFGGVFSTAYMHQIVETSLAQGALPSQRQLWQLFLENLLTMSMMEVGGRTLRPLTEEIGLWARGRRLGTDRATRIDALRADTRQFLDTVSRLPTNSGQQRSTELLTQQRELLSRRQALADELRRELPRSGDAEVIEREYTQEHQLTQDALSLLREAEFIQQTGARPASEEGGNEFFYRPGTEAQLRDFFGASNVRAPDRQGTIRVQTGGREIIFRPEPAEGSATAPQTGVRGTAASELFTLANTPQITNSAQILQLLAPGARTGGRAVLPALATRLHGSIFSYTTGSRFMSLMVPSPGGGTIEVQVVIRARGYDARGNRLPNEPATTNSTDRVSYTLRYNRTLPRTAPGAGSQAGGWEAEITVDSRLQLQNSRSEDLELGVGHELDEIADVVRRVEPLTQRDRFLPGETTLEQAQQREVRPRVFERGSQERATSLTSDDRARAQQAKTIFDRLESARGRLINPPPSFDRAPAQAEIARLEGQFERMLEIMGLNGQSSSLRLVEFRRGLELAGQNDVAFLNEVEAHYQQSKYSAYLQRSSVRLPGGRSIFTLDIIKHLIFPERATDFEGSGIPGGHRTAEYEALNNNPDSPYFVVREATIRLPWGDYAHRYHQYEAMAEGRPAPNKRGSPRLPSPTPGGPGATPGEGVQFDPAMWQLSNVPKSTINDIQAFMQHADQAFAEYFRTSIQGTGQASGRPFDFVHQGVRYMGYYNYNPATNDVSVNSIFIHASSIP